MVRPVAAVWPVTLGYRQKARFNPRYIHRGIDYGSPTGTPVVATTGGTVVYAGRGGGYGPAFGIHVVIKTSETWHLYGHLSAEHVSTGQIVQAGQQIGKSGATGNVTGAHLHYAEFTQGPAAYTSDRAPRFIDAAAPWLVYRPPTVFDLSFWAQAHAPWFGKAWAPRADRIGKELVGNEAGTEASIHAFTEVFTAEQVATIAKALGPNFKRANRVNALGGPAGIEVFYDATKWDLQRTPRGYASGVANRSAFVVHLTRISTGAHVAMVAAHGPIKAEAGNAGKDRYSRWLADLVRSVDGPVVLVGDFNIMPMGRFRDMGFRGYKEQAAIANEGAVEFPAKRRDYSDILTIASQARITGGQVDNTSLELSDHRRIEARIVLDAA